eukprot:m.119300 g.119300  ORF g.119300 m.119300 type:complete len:150 (+) comp28723_c0_seq1:270-719(+)
MWVHSFIPSLASRASNLGVEMDFEGDVGNSFDSLRLLHWAGETSPDLQESFARELGHGHFTRRECVADHEVLIKAVDKVGLSSVDARRVLQDKTAFRDDVRNAIDNLHTKGIHSIPVFIFHTKDRTPIEVDGARSSDEYASVLTALAQG